jgi:L-lactate dehydrogenase complex protein LldF
VHVAVMGMERIVRDWDELDVMLALLARSATGQALSVYTNIISGPRRAGELDGPEELHVVVLDNGRSNLIGTAYEETLACIRCGACLNVCPVYRHVGGHAYQSVYSGPIGAVLTPLLLPEDAAAAELPRASTLCGACTDVCPVRIPLHDLLLRLRQRPSRSTRGFDLWSHVWSTSLGYRASVHMSRVGLRLARVLPKPGWIKVWSRDRALPRGSRR